MKKSLKLAAAAFSLSMLPLLPVPVFAQVSSATITGAVRDSSGGVIPHAKVTATETATGVKTVAETNGSGEYTLPLLKPGTYSITAEFHGFNRYEQRGLALSSGDHPTIDIPLVVGDTTQTIQVTSAAPLLGTEDANVGQVVPGELLENLPLSGRTPLSVAQFTVGVVATTNPVGVRPFDNSAVAAFSVGGLPNKNSEILMDGSPDNASDNAPAYELPLDAAREVSIKVFESDATYGHSGGGVANQITKSGTNRLHGTLSEFHQDSALNAYPYFSKRSPGYKPSVSRQNQFGGTIGGPVFIPKLYNGRDKLFFFFAYEGFYDSGSGGSYTSVPTTAERAGDFSQVLSQGNTRTDTECSKVVNGTKVTVASAPYNSQAIFDPTSGVINQACAALGFTIYDRTAFANNNITSGKLPLNPVALKALQFFPQPNAPGNAVGQNNYYSTAETGDRYNNELGRLDWDPSPRQRLYFTGRHSQRVQYNNEVFGAANPALGDFLYRINYGGSVGDIITFTPSLLADVRLNYTRYSQPSYTNGDGFDPSSLGLPALPSAHLMFPRFFFSGSVANLGATTQTPGTAPFNSYDLFTDVIKTAGTHSVKFGVDIRKFQKGNFTFGNSAGLYNFNGDFTDAFGTDPNGGALGSDTAAFLLGLPSSASYDFNSHAVANQTYMGLFVQDDWRVTSNLTLNLGVRVDKDFSPNEREGTAVNGFNTTATNPYSAAATAAYAANANPTLAPANFKVNGGLTFNQPGGLISNFTSTMVSPRVGFAFKPPMLKETVIRGGFGIFVIPIFPFNNSINQEGFSQTTQAPIVDYTPPSSATGPGTLSNPFPNGLTPPPGSSLGLATFAGQSVTFLDPNIRNGYSERFNIGVQHQFPGNLLVDTFYEGSTGRRLPISQSLNYVQPQYLTTASNPGLSASVANPFYGIIPNGGTLNSSKTVNLTTLLQAFPEFGAITEQNVPAGSSIFHALDIRVEHRTGYGLSITANYQWSKLLEAVSYLNAFDPRPEYRISQYDHPTHAVIAVSYQLPFGRGRRYGGNIPRYVDLPLGGWNVASSWFYQQGSPLTFGNLSPTGQPLHYNARQATEYAGQPGTTQPSFNINAFNNNISSTSTTIPQQGLGGNPAFNTQLTNNIRTFGSQYANLRNDALNDWDASVLKDFNFTERSFLQLRLEGFNVNNRPVFSGPNLSPTSAGFAQITGTQNSNRVVQIGARISF
jgi:hypothetical protein